MFQQTSTAAENPTDLPSASGESGARIRWPDVAAVATMLWRRKTWIIGATIVALLAAFLVILIVPPKFVATAQILLDPSDLRVMDNSVTPASQTSDSNVAQIESQVRVLTSDTVLRRMIASERLDQDPEFVGGGPSRFRGAIQSIRALFGFEAARRDDDPTLTVLRELRKRISARRAERTYVVDLSVESKDPDKAARIANAIAQAYLEDSAAARSESARRASGSLTGRLAELQESVRKAEQRVEQFKTEHNIVGASGQLVNEQQLSEISNQLMQARGRTAEAQARYDQIERLRRSGAEPGAIAEAVQSGTVTALRAQYAEIVRREAELTAKLGARHPAVAEIRAQARDLRRLIAEEIARIGQAAYNDLVRARSSEAALARSLEETKREATATNEALVRLRELQREVDSSRAVYEAFLMRARETGEQQRIDTTNVRVISKAEPPQYRASPPRNLVLFTIALVIGLGAGTGLAFFRERTDDRITSPLGLAGMTGWPVLAVLPDIKGSLRRWSQRGPAAPAETPATDIPKDKADGAEAPFAQELRALRDVFGNRDAHAGESVLLLSAGDAAGKTTVALNMAFAAATSGQKVLLIDGDIGDRTLTKAVAARSASGLVEVLKGALPLTEALIRDPQTGLHVLPIAGAKRGPMRIVEAADIARLLADAKDFDVILIDGPADPHAPMARMLADAAQHIVITATGGATRAKNVARVMAAVESHKSKVRGTMMADGVRTAA